MKIEKILTVQSPFKAKIKEQNNLNNDFRRIETQANSLEILASYNKSTIKPDPDKEFKLKAKEILKNHSQFDEPKKQEIINNTTSKNFSILEDLLTLSKIFYSDKSIALDKKIKNNSSVYQILNLTKQGENVDVVEKLINASEKKGRHFINCSRILKTLNNINENNKNALDIILETAKTIKHPGLVYHGIEDILKVANKDNEMCLYDLILQKDNDGSQRFCYGDIVKILSVINKENNDCLAPLLSAKTKNDGLKFSNEEIKKILQNTTSYNKHYLNTLINAKDKYNNDVFSNSNIITIMEQNAFYSNNHIKDLIKRYLSKEISMTALISSIQYNIGANTIINLEKAVGKSVFNTLASNEINRLFLFKDLINKKETNEIPPSKKRETLKYLVRYNTDLFDFSKKVKKSLPLLPKDEKEYNKLLSELVKSLDALNSNKTKLSKAQEDKFFKDIFELSNVLKNLKDEDFNNLKISQTYSNHHFAYDVHNIIKNLDDSQRQKIYNHFNFELFFNKEQNCYSFFLYPQIPNDENTSLSTNKEAKTPIKRLVNLFNGAKLKEDEINEAIEKINPLLERYNNDNKINSNRCANGCNIEILLNEIVKPFGELRTIIGRKQHGKHDFDTFSHSLKVAQKVVQNPSFNSLNYSDKKILLLTSLFHDISKKENMVDYAHPRSASFDTYNIAKKLNLSKDEELKLYNLIRYHQWLSKINKAPNDEKKEEILLTAYNLQYDNLFELSKILTIADLKAVKKDDLFFEDKKDDFYTISKQVEEQIPELKKTQPILPTTKFPSASRVMKEIKYINDDYSTNLKGVYVDEQGLVIIRFNEVENETFEKIGFEKNSISKGIKINDFINTGNIKFFVHGLSEKWQLLNFDEFKLPDSNSLLSVSYDILPESNFQFYKNQGVILNANLKSIHGGGDNNSGSGHKKHVEVYKRICMIGNNQEARAFVSNLIKEKLNLSDAEYIQFINENKNKSLAQIEDKNLSHKLIEALIGIKTKMADHKKYNEFYITNPEVMALFACCKNGKIDDIQDFMDNQKEFLKDYALKNDKIFMVFD